MGRSRLISRKPEIGIRPIIGSRCGGIRESLEKLSMAHKVTGLYSSVLRCGDGSPVECVIADTSVGGVTEAAMVAENSDYRACKNHGLFLQIK